MYSNFILSLSSGTKESLLCTFKYIRQVFCIFFFRDICPVALHPFCSSLDLLFAIPVVQLHPEAFLHFICIWFPLSKSLVIDSGFCKIDYDSCSFWNCVHFYNCLTVFFWVFFSLGLSIPLYFSFGYFISPWSLF